MAYEEFYNRTFTRKIDELNNYTNNKKYTKEMMTKVRDDLYELVRSPYLKYNYFKYILVNIGLFLPNVILSFVYLYIPSDHDWFKIISVSEIFRVYKGGILAFIMFALPGIIFYRVSI